MPRLTAQQFLDESIYRQTRVVRYATGQVNVIRSIVDQLNEKIARYCIRKEIIETKAQYQDCRVHIRKLCLDYRNKTYKYLQKELKGFIREQATWVKEHSPVELKVPRDTIKQSARDAFFVAFSDTDNVKSYVTRIFNQIFQLWNAQLTIAYRIGTPAKEMAKNITGKDYRK